LLQSLYYNDKCLPCDINVNISSMISVNFKHYPIITTLLYFQKHYCLPLFRS